MRELSIFIDESGDFGEVLLCRKQGRDRSNDLLLFLITRICKVDYTAKFRREFIVLENISHRIFKHIVVIYTCFHVIVLRINENSLRIITRIKSVYLF